MIKETKKAPTIRFRGFTDDWEQRKLGDLAGKTYGGGTPKTSEEIFWNGEIPWFQSSDLVEDKVLSATPKKRITEKGLQKSAAQLIPGNSIAIITRVGVGKLAFIPFSYTTSQDFLSLSSLNIDGIFGCYAIYKLLQREKSLTQGTSIKGVTKEELLRKFLWVPCQDEQIKIGMYLSDLDNLITLHQRKLDQLKTLKKYFLQNMFPAKGEKVPRIRFKGFTGDWEQHKLDNLCLIIDTKHATAPITNEKTSYRMIRTDCVRNGRLLVENMDSVTKEIYDKWSERIHLKAGDIVFTREAPMGESAIIPDDGNSYFPGQRIVTIRSKGNVSTLFINYLIYANEFRREIRIRDSAATTVANFGIPSIKNYVAQLPCVKEQRKIGKYFNQLDNLITLHQRKLEQLQTMKKFMLQNLFI